MTDESFLYRAGLEEYNKQSVYHSKLEWVRYEKDFKVHTNLVENFWSVMKRGVYGIITKFLINTYNVTAMNLAIVTTPAS